jgi:predicted transcriptional regulator
MKTIQVRLPDSIHGKVRRLANDEHMSLNQFMVTSISNEVIRHETSDFFREASARFSEEAFKNALASVPDVPAQENDRITQQRRVAEPRSPYGSRR